MSLGFILFEARQANLKGPHKTWPCVASTYSHAESDSRLQTKYPAPREQHI